MVPRRGEWETPFSFRLIYLTKSKKDSGCKQAAVAMLYGMSFLFLCRAQEWSWAVLLGVSGLHGNGNTVTMCA